MSLKLSRDVPFGVVLCLVATTQESAAMRAATKPRQREDLGRFG